MKRIIAFFATGLVIAAIAGCSSTKVTRVDVDKQVDFSGQWNDTDATMVAQEMVTDSLGKPWREDFIKAKGRNPVVIIGSVSNRTSEHIDSQSFTKFLERELLNSGKVTFVASPEERHQIRGEREDQAGGDTDQATMAARGKELGADYMMIGSLNSTKDEVKGKFVVLYQANLELVDLSTNTKVWIGQKQIKKIAEKKGFSF